MSNPKRNTTVKYQPPRGLARTCSFVRSHETHNGIWWELKEAGGGTFRARPGACKVQAN